MSSARPSVTLDEQLAGIMQAAIESSLRGMFGVPVRCGDFTIGKDVFDGKYENGAAVASVLEMRQLNRLCGVFVVIFSRKAIETILASCEINPANDSVKAEDAIGEIVNLIYGKIKNALNQTGHSFTLGLPRNVSNDPAFFDEYLACEKASLSFSVDGHDCHAVIIAKT